LTARQFVRARALGGAPFSSSPREKSVGKRRRRRARPGAHAPAAAIGRKSDQLLPGGEQGRDPRVGYRIATGSRILADPTSMRCVGGHASIPNIETSDASRRPARASHKAHPLWVEADRYARTGGAPDAPTQVRSPAAHANAGWCWRSPLSSAFIRRHRENRREPE